MSDLRAAIDEGIRDADRHGLRDVPDRGPLVVLLASPGDWPREPRLDGLSTYRGYAVLRVLVDHPDATLRHLARAHALMRIHRDSSAHTFWRDQSVFRSWCEKRGTIDLDEVAQSLERDHVEGEQGLVAVAVGLGRAATPASVLGLLERWPASVVELLDGGEVYERRDRLEAFARVLAFLPPSERLAAVLVPWALGAPRSIATPLRRWLGFVPTATIAELVREKRRDRREAAVRWLGERRDPAAVPALQAALRKERTDAVRAELLAALEACGAPVPLDRAELLAAATARAADARERLAFLSPDTLPSLRWDDGAPVGPELAWSWLLDALKEKDVEPSAMVKRLARSMDRRTTEALGRAVLDRWIAWDTRVPTLDDEARARLQPIATRVGTTLEDLLGRFDAKNYGLPASSGAAEKGVLAVVAALGGRDVVDPIDAYVRLHRGFRASQCRALLGVLAGMEDRRATQVLLRFASRFRTPGIQKEARTLVDELALRRGWTAAQLADRTMPSAGLDDDGTLTLVYGTRASEDPDADVVPTRRFVARLNEHDELQLHAEDGTRLAAPPDARKGEDEVVTAAEKKRWATAKKELKALLRAEADRLREAMMAGRAWTFAELDTYVLRHPVAGRLARRVVFRAEHDGRTTTFRPAGDGSLVGAENDTVVVDPEASVSLAHTAVLAPELDAAWRAHLGDYEVVPLFAQLGRPSPPPEAIVKDHLVLPAAPPLAIALRGKAKRAGYDESRGDGGFIERFVRVLPTLGRALSLDIEGIDPMADKTATVAIIGLALEDSRGAGDRGGRLPWSEAPPILRDEAWADLRAILD